ncbi:MULTISPECIES: MarR family transcriptional regulator [Mammaliicoccus]|uniref:MarR family winged helix-turn-helix transcriptional regulator n=1 Tax=Mammaliicoccus TaxID=2803850 RepID=UPI001EEE6CEA|nr:MULTISPECIES: MarR family transcriptional regulator [Mammaliicoccus]MDT3995737.1 MarR family transcriptional regulator [Mammaliicoccus fleurettii]MEB7724217.1 MarR family transcriptional regulator [Mammaliicoccus fleurettii]MEB7779947.1 MarR family transcriptional regulator [Mammaliicoccus fleurettii]MEB7805901.1 MarR family transcriptional regulator [Mammaliicoccus fleurettii]MEB8068574.1 MarR family transcriptional regulator [Mammaliicoccus fleurettii]
MDTKFFELLHTLELLKDKTITIFMNRFKNVNISQIILLSKLKEDGPQKSSTIAEKIGYTPGAITGMTNKLIKEEYILRVPQEYDRRVTLISITDKGIKLLEEAQKQEEILRNDIYSTLNDEETEQLLKIQKKLLEQVDRLK